MFDLHGLIGKSLIDGNNGQELGEIVKIAWDKPYGVSVVTTTLGIYRLAKLTSNNQQLVAICESNDEPRNIQSLESGKEIYDANGKRLGEIANVQFNNAMKLTIITATDGQTYTRGRITAAEDIVIVKSNAAPQRKRAATKPKTNKEKTATEDVKQLPEDLTNIQTQTTETIAASPEPAQSRNNQYQIKRRYGDFSFLLGKTVDKNILNFYGEIMLKRGEKITLDALRQAKLSGKLLELCLHAN